MHQQQSDLIKNLCEEMKKESKPLSTELSAQKHWWLYRINVYIIVSVIIFCKRDLFGGLKRVCCWVNVQIEKWPRSRRITQIFKGASVRCYNIIWSFSSCISSSKWYLSITNYIKTSKIYDSLQLGFESFRKSSFYGDIMKGIEQRQIPQIPLYKIVGLRNIGNTCYINSTLQCLINLREFSQKFVKQVHKLDESQLNQKLSKQYQILLQYFWKNQNSQPFEPRKLKQIVGEKRDRFNGNKQQDAHEFLSTFLEIIGEQLNRVKIKPKYKRLESDPKKSSAKKLSEQWWQYQKSRQDSVVQGNFQGQTVSGLSCQGCQKQSLTFNTAVGLSLTMSNKIQSISQLILNDWKAVNEIEGYYCDSCKKQENCTQKVEIFRLPPILVIHLKRFAQFEWTRKKIETAVKIDEQIDFEKVMHEQAPQNKLTYKLTGVVNHYGGLKSGHYTACVYNRNEKKWYLANDSTVSETTLQSTNKSAYLLFYERV